MADIRMPDEIIAWMQERDWGNHHDMWHVVRRWDIYHRMAEQGDPDGIAIVKYIEANGWERAEYQEGAAGDGREFLGMHRAMLQLLVEEFPGHAELFQGWPTPPRDPAAPDDPVSDGSEFDANKAAGVDRIEGDPGSFADDDDFGIFVETMLRPTPENPSNRTDDQRSGVHNYLHNRWTNPESDINLGDPRVNIFNERFWSLHGWIDRVWTQFRVHHGLSDDNPAYRDLIERNRHHMAHIPHHFFAAALELTEGRIIATRPEILRTIQVVETFGE